MKIELDNVYPTFVAIERATDEQIEQWFLNLQAHSNIVEAEKWGLISGRYYLGID